MVRGINWKFWGRIDKSGSRTRKIKVVRRYFVSYVVVLLIPILLSIAIYRESFVLAEQQTRIELESSLNRVGQFITLRLREIERLVALLDSNTALRRFQYLTNEGVRDNYFRLISLKNSLFPYSRVSTLVLDYFVAFKRNDYVVTPTYGGTLEQLYRHRFLRHFDSYRGFRSRLFDSYHSGTVAHIDPPSSLGDGRLEEIDPGVGYLVSLGSSFRSDAVVFVELSLSAIESALSIGGGRDGEWLALTVPEAGGREVVIAEYGDRRAESAEERILLEFPVGDGGLVLKAAYPVVTAPSYTRRVSLIVGGSIAISTLVGLVIAFLLSRAQSRPLQMLLRQLGRGDHEEPDESVTAQIDSIIRNHARLRAAIDQQRPVLQSAALGKLFRGEYHDEQSARRSLSLAGIEPDSRWFAGLLITAGFPTPLAGLSATVVGEIEAIQSLLREGVAGVCPFPIYDLDGAAVLVLAGSAEADRESAFRAVRWCGERVAQTLAKGQGIATTVSVGRLVPRLSEVAQSASGAQQLADHLRAEGASGVYSVREDGDSVSAGLSDFPVELENRITAAIRTGSEAETTAQIRSLLEGNARRKTATPAVLRVLRVQICGMLHRVAVGIPTEYRAEVAHRLEQLSTVYDSQVVPEDELLDVANDLARFFARRKKSHNEVLFAKMASIIQSDLSNPDLSLAWLADRCSISEVYASQFFKEQSGESFSSYVDRLRMERARALLRSDDRRVKEVAHEVGYRNVNSFNRAFKRVVGVTPGRYRSAS
jgi:AraC-like DNA-binding protein